MMVAVYHIIYYIATPPTALIVLVTTTTVPLPVANPALNHAYLLYLLYFGNLLFFHQSL